jgi:hypothetical protein
VEKARAEREICYWLEAEGGSSANGAFVLYLLSFVEMCFFFDVVRAKLCIFRICTAKLENLQLSSEKAYFAT